MGANNIPKIFFLKKTVKFICQILFIVEQEKEEVSLLSHLDQI
jgi:hypothetical protein